MESLQLQEFFVEGGNQQKSHVLLHITEPSNAEEETRGNFFAVAETSEAEAAAIVDLQKIIEDMETTYYSDLDTENESPLEAVLKKINHHYWGGTKERQGLNCVVGAICNSEVSFSIHGQPQVLLFYKNKEGFYKKMDLASPDTDDDNQLFSQLVQGKISQGDYLLITTPNVIRYFNHDRLEKIITSRAPQQSAEHLERVLGELKNDLSFGGLIVHLSPLDSNRPMAARASRPANNGSEKSLKRLFNTEKNTANTLASSVLPRWSEKINKVLNVKNSSTSTSKNLSPQNTNTKINSTHVHPFSRPSQTNTGDKYISALNTALKIIKTGAIFLATGTAWLGITLFRLISEIARLTLSLFFVATNFQNRRRNILDNWRKSRQNLKLYFTNLPRATKILMSAAALTALIFLVGIIYLHTQKQTSQKNKIFENNLSQIIAEKDSAESALVYGDSDNALVALKSARELLAATDCSAKSKQTRCDLAAKQINDLLAQLRKIFPAEIQTLTNWTDTDINNIFKINNTIIAYSSSSTILYTYDLLTKQTGQINTMFNGYTDSAVPKENDFAVLLFNNSELARFSPENKSVKKIDIGYPADEPNIASVALYNRHLYSLDKYNQQIYRHDLTKTGFGLGQPWVKSDNDYLASADDLTIDGDIFLTHSNGQATKWSSGQKDDFSARGLYPPLSPGSKLWTYNDLNYLYILDPSEQRLIIMDKTGNLINQIDINSWSNPQGLIVEESQKHAFVVDGGKLYQISLP